MPHRGIFPLMFLCLPMLAATAVHRVLVDAPGRLEIEVALPDVALIPSSASGGMRVIWAPSTDCDLCGSGSVRGAPDLPVFAFDMLTGPFEPRVAIRILESEIRVVPEGIASVGLSLSP